MRVTILVLASCMLAGCGMDSNAPASKLTTLDQVPPACQSYFRKSAGTNKQMFDKLVAAYDPKDGLTPEQCAQLDAETPASN